MRDGQPRRVSRMYFPRSSASSDWAFARPPCGSAALGAVCAISLTRSASRRRSPRTASLIGKYLTSSFMSKDALKGLVKNTVAPAINPAASADFSCVLVRIAMGVLALQGNWRMRSQASRPLSFGIFKSRMISAAGIREARPTASRPSAVRKTLRPSVSNFAWSTLRIIGSSSATMTLPTMARFMTGPGPDDQS